MKAILALLLSLSHAMVYVSLGDDNSNTETEVTTKVRDTNSDEKCERLFPKLTNLLCVYKCKSIDLTFEKEDDGTPCGYFVFEGKCKNGWCVPESSRISVRSVEPMEDSSEPTKELPVPTEETLDTVV